MTTVSPTPFFSSSSFGNGRSTRQALSRSAGRSGSATAAAAAAAAARPSVKRHSPLSSIDQGHGFAADAPGIQRISIGDSSDDDIPQPMKFSALTEAILEDRGLAKDHSPPPQSGARQQQQDYTRRRNDDVGHTSRGETPSRGPLRISRRSPPDAASNRASPPRVVHLSSSKNSSGLRRTASSGSGSLPTRRHHEEHAPLELVTPAPAPRTRSAYSSRDGSVGTSGPSSQSQPADYESGQEGDDDHRQMSNHDGAAELQNGGGILDSSNRLRSKSAAEQAPGSMRVKRVPIGSGTFLRGAPMRRGVRRRNSEEEQSPADQEPGSMASSSDQRRGQERKKALQALEEGNHANHEPIHVQDFAREHHDVRNSSSRNRTSARDNDEVEVEHGSSAEAHGQRPHFKHSSTDPESENERLPASQEPPVFKLPSLPPVLPSQHDQENEPPPTFKRNKSQVMGVLDKPEKLPVFSQKKDSRMLGETPGTISPQRQPLVARSVNTPQRAAPPPPKMTVLETATANGGASTVKSKKKRSHITINGKVFSLRGRLGKGGSSDVYRVMAENDKMFALKKVNLEDCNEDTVRGYKGEIDLLKRLEDVERVVRLFDWEINEQKQSLSVLMEIGESDLNRILSLKLHPENATLDLSFTRHYWREMLHCVEAVHAYNIVHSDLKPANFLLVQGRLKLIDFGIANAIDIDNTVNVHRETNVGTPNYMSPESLQDTNADKRATQGPVAKLMKIGKPSDVWSLGCILYQMTYGKPPFAHITNQWNRVMAIINPSVTISYPACGVGDVPVPAALRRLLKSCLNRDPTQRPSIAQLLDDREPFLNPDWQLDRFENDGAVPMTEHVLEQILQKIVERCRDPKRGVPTDDELKVYPKAFLDRVRGIQRS